MTSDEIALAGVKMQPVKWDKLPEGDLPYAVFQGRLHIGDDCLRCYQLSDGRRIFDAGDLERLLDIGSPPPLVK